jgi:hypothetical protein
MNAQLPHATVPAQASGTLIGRTGTGADDAGLARLGAFRGEGFLVAADDGGRGTLRFPPQAARGVEGLAATGEPLLYRGYLMEGVGSTPIVADVHVLEIRRVFTGVEVDVAFGDAANGVPASFRFVG